MKELKVEDALLYLDQVKMEFGDRPHIYNEFLDIMKTFKTQQIDTPGVIRRVSNLFQGNRRLVLGFNTFLPEGYKIELPADGDGPPVAVFRAPGSTVAHVLNGSTTTTTTTTTTPSDSIGGSVTQQQASPVLTGDAAAQHAQGLHGPLASTRPLTMRDTGSQSHQQPRAHGAGTAGGPHRRFGDSPMPGQASAASPLLGQGPSLGHEARTPLEQLGALVPSAPHTQQQPLTQQQQQQQPPLQPIRSSGDGKLPARTVNAHPTQALQGAQGALGQASGSGIVGATQPSPQHVTPQGQPQQAPLEFDHAINYVTTIKRRFANEPETYKKFLEILHTYQKEQRGIKEVLDEVSVLFADHADLLKQFTYFLPDAVQAQAKLQLDEAAKEAENKKRSQARQAIMHTAQDMQRTIRTPPVDLFEQRVVHIPFGATQGRTAEEEREIVESAEYGTVSFAPVRPPKSEPNGSPIGSKQLRPRSIPSPPKAPDAAETALFFRVEHHLKRKELMPEKPVGPKRHTPYREFLKCLHLFGAGVLNKEELLLLLRGLFTTGHAPKSGNATNQQVALDATELLREFEQIFVGRGPFAQQEEKRKDKSKYGSVRVRDMTIEGCAQPTPSYRSYPQDYPAATFLVHPSRLLSEARIINGTFVSVAKKRSRITDSLETYDGIKKRHNVYEEAMARIEDERYEVDMAIARNAQALVQIEPLAQEALKLRQGEEKDGQPIGRLQYKLHRRNAIGSVVINAIARIYGDRGDEVIHHLNKNPLIVLPIVYQRLKQKHDEWGKIRDGCKEQWNAATLANYEGCMDVRCYYRRRELERSFFSEYIMDQCKRARFHHSRYENSSVVSYSIGLSDPKALCYDPCVNVKSEVDHSHKCAFQLVSLKVRKNSNSSLADLERIGRIWSEFMVPWYGYPSHWVMEEMRQSFLGRLSHSVVKFAVGQKVKTIFGDGTIVLFLEAEGRYRVKMSYGTAFLGPTAILHSIPSKSMPFIRRDGMMVLDTDAATTSEGPCLAPDCQVLFATRSIYLFLRLHLQLCNTLAELRSICDGSVAQDPATVYVVPPGEEQTRHSLERLDFTGMMAALKEVITKQRDPKGFETFARKISKEHVHVIASLPKLVEKCADALFSVAKEDVLFYLYDHCQYREVNPSILREHCFSVAREAEIRVQFNGKSTSFSYLPRGVTLKLSAQEVAFTNGSKAVAMDIDMQNHAVGERATKRVKTKH